MDHFTDNFFRNIGIILFISFVFGGWVIVGVANSIMGNLRRMRQSEHLTILKQTMIEKGMSADEIERILRAGMDTIDKGKDAAADAT